MKRFIYIVLLSVATVVVITLLDMLFTGEDTSTDRSVLDNVSRREFEMPIRDAEEAGLWNVKYPLHEIVTDSEGNEHRTQTALFTIEQITHVAGNEYEAQNISFEFYDKRLFERPAAERITASGRADRAKLFSKGDSELAGVDLEFKSEFVLKDNVHIDAFLAEEGTLAFSLDSHDLIFREERFDSTQAVTLSKEGMIITGEGLECDLKTSSFRLLKNIRIEGSRFDLSMLDGEGGAPAADEPRAHEASLEDSAPMTLTARGPLDLFLADSSQNRSSAFSMMQGGTAAGPLNRLRMEGDVTLTRQDLSFRCDTLHLDFMETEDNRFEIRILRGLSDRKRTQIQVMDYPIACDDFDYQRQDDTEVFYLRGKPEIHNVSMPLLSSLSNNDTPELLDLYCGDLLRIDCSRSPDRSPETYDVHFSGGVRISKRDAPEPPLLKSDQLAFRASMAPKADDSGEQPDGTSPAGEVSIQDFVAQGAVSGQIEDYFLEGDKLTYNFVDTPQGTLSELQLQDDESSGLVTEEFSLHSPRIDIALRPDITEITSHGTFSCSADLEEMPELSSFSLLPGPEENETARVEEPQPEGGRIEMQGLGDFRLLISDDAGVQRQNILIQNSPRFDMHLFRGEETVLFLEGKQTFSLVVLGGDLSQLHLNDGGNIDCPELGFYTSGDSLLLERTGEDSLRFVTMGGQLPAHVELSQPEKDEKCKILAREIRIFTGLYAQLEAEGNVTADLPAGLFAAKEETDQQDGRITGTDHYNVQCENLQLEQLEGSRQFVLTCTQNCVIRGETTGLEAVGDLFSYDSGDKILALRGSEGGPARVKIRTQPDSDIYDSVVSEKMDVNLRDATARIYRGGTVNLTHYDELGAPQGRISVTCDHDMDLEENRLHLKGPLLMEYQAVQRKDTRYLACSDLFIYFEESPLREKLTVIDLETYKAMVKEPRAPDAGEFTGNRIKRLKAVEDVNLRFQDYSVACARLTWELLNDDIRCEGMGDRVEISLKNQVSIRGGEVSLRPVNEEFTVLNH